MAVPPVLVRIGFGIVLGAWRWWNAHRNSLPDEVRARLFWNDERYIMLHKGITYAWWTLAAVLALFTAFIYAAMWGWLDWLFE